LKKTQFFENMGRLQLTGMPADVLALVLAACTVPALHRAAATNKLIHEAGAERRRKIAVLKQSPFCMTWCVDVKTVHLYDGQLDDSTVIKLSEALASGALPLLRDLILGANQIGDEGMVKFSEALATGAMAQLEACSLPTALSPSPETWHAHSPDPDVLCGVQYAEPFAQR
jgi:hypothetical protein